MKKAITFLLAVSMVLSNGFIVFAAEEMRVSMSEDLSEMEELSLDELEIQVDGIINQMKIDKKNGFVPFELVKDYAEDDEIEPLSIYDEEEPNDTARTANEVTLNDRCYGTISDLDDVDYYVINFEESGYLTITLKYIPDDCDYDLFFFGSKNISRDEIESSERAAGKNEYIYTYVTQGVDYYVRIDSIDGYDEEEEYRLSFDLDDTVAETSFSVGTDYQMQGSSEAIDTTEEAENAMTELGRMGYANYWTSMPTYDVLMATLPGGNAALESSVITLHGHGKPGFMYFNYHGLVQANNHQYYVAIRTNEDIETNEGLPKYISLEDLSLEDVRMMVFSGCHTAESRNSENLAKYAKRLGVETTIGWEGVVNDVVLADWNGEFMYNLRRGYDVLDAANLADDYIMEKKPVSDTIFDWNIYGNNSNVLRLSGPRTIQMAKDNLLNVGDSVFVKMKNNDISDLDAYIESLSNVFSMDDYRCIIREVGENLYKVNYNLVVNDFDTGCGYYAMVENNEVISISQYGDFDKLCGNDTQQVVVTEEMVQKAKVIAAERLSNEYEITEQTVDKIVRDGAHYLNVTTKYVVNDMMGGYDAVQTYQYSLD